MDKKYRKLTAAEISSMESSGCRAEDWDRITVAAGFSHKNVRNVLFRGSVAVHDNSGHVVSGPDTLECGIYNSEIKDCNIGAGVRINCVHSLSGYDIGDGSVIENCGRITVDGPTTFGNGTVVAAVNENGGRPVIIHDRITAQTAYIEAMYLHRKDAVDALKRLSSAYCDSKRGIRGQIGPHVQITGCGRITNVNIGPGAQLSGAAELTNGTISSSTRSPAHIGTGVIARDFIISHGAILDTGATIKRCFAGENSRLSEGFTAQDCLFFANCEMAAGEACSVFAGPHTVSHHRSSLLIAGYFSFFNAGSGTNQSNHLFKTGPVHQGVHERGCKFGSNAYVMLPAREGPFTVVVGRHSSHHDTSDFPFSYLVEQEGKSWLMPALNIRSYGTFRDMKKWPERDKRTGPRADIINYDQFNPYIGERIARAVTLSAGLSSGLQDAVSHNRVKIKTGLLKKGIGLYGLMLDSTVGYLLEEGNAPPAEINTDCRAWADLAGMYAPMSEVDKLLDVLSAGHVTGFSRLTDMISELNGRYREFAAAWAYSFLSSRKDGDIPVEQAVRRGREALEALRKLQQEDGGKDFAPVMHTSYGIDTGRPDQIQADFDHVRGNLK